MEETKPNTNIRYSLFVIRYSLFVICYLLFVICSLITGYWSLVTGHCNGWRKRNPTEFVTDAESRIITGRVTQRDRALVSVSSFPETDSILVALAENTNN